MADTSSMSKTKKYFFKIAYKVKSNYKSISPLTYLLFCVFGVGSWVAINGIWAQLPILLVTQPECYKLAPVLSVVIQLANIGPLLYSLTKLIWSTSRRFSTIYLEIISVYTLLLIGLSSTVLLSLFWHKTGQIGGQTHSIVLIILTFFLSLVDCTSSVVFIPFMKHFPAVYLSALYIGEGLSGVLPSTLALIQGSVNNSVHCNPGVETYSGIGDLGIRYSPSIFYLLLSLLLLMCGIAFTALIFLPLIKKVIKRRSLEFIQEEGQQNTNSPLIINGNNDNSPFIIEEEEIDDSEEEKEEEEGEGDLDQMSVESNCGAGNTRSSLHEFFFITWQQRTPLTCILLISFVTNGSLSSIAPYAFGHYGNTIIHLAINLGILANPIGALFYALVSIKSRLMIAICTSAVSILGLYVMVHSMLDSSMIVPGLAGGVIIVIVNIIIGGLSSYTKVSASVLLHSDPLNSDTALFLNGICNQIGSLLGAVLFYCLVYYTNIYN